MKLLRLGNSAWDFLGVNFLVKGFAGVLLEVLGTFFGFHFCPHSIIPSLALKSGLLRTFHSHSEHAGKICSFFQHLRLYHQSLYRVAKKEGKLYMFGVFACARNKT